MIEHALRTLLLQTLSLTVATGLVLALQASVLRPLGAAASYLAWLLVPVAMLAVALPHPTRDALVIHFNVAAIAPAWAAMAPAVREATTPAWAVVSMAAWLGGAALLAVVLWRRQRGFEALLNASCLPAGTGPAVLGVWRRRIVLPQDFESAFDSEERRLMLLHEGVHLRRADNAWNLLASALLVLHWFNPVAWWAWRCLRAEQELACDAAVLRQESPAALATYAAALLKVQGVALAPPLATSWHSTHPLVERVRMLQRHRISSARHRTGLRLAALSILLAGIGSYALRAGASAAPDGASDDKTSILTSVSVEIDRKSVTGTPPMMLTIGGEKTTLRLSGDPARNVQAAEIAYTATRLSGDRVEFDAELRLGGALVGSPRVITRDGEPARLEIQSADGAHVFGVTLLPRLVPPNAATSDGATGAGKPAAQRAL